MFVRRNGPAISSGGTGIDAETPLEISTDGEVIVISPVRSAKRIAKLRRTMEKAHARYAGAFKRLAE